MDKELIELGDICLLRNGELYIYTYWQGHWNNANYPGSNILVKEDGWYFSNGLKGRGPNLEFKIGRQHSYDIVAVFRPEPEFRVLSIYDRSDLTVEQILNIKKHSIDLNNLINNDPLFIPLNYYI